MLDAIILTGQKPNGNALTAMKAGDIWKQVGKHNMIFLMRGDLFVFYYFSFFAYFFFFKSRRTQLILSMGQLPLVYSSPFLTSCMLCCWLFKVGHWARSTLIYTCFNWSKVGCRVPDNGKSSKCNSGSGRWLLFPPWGGGEGMLETLFPPDGVILSKDGGIYLFSKFLMHHLVVGLLYSPQKKITHC